MLLSKFFMNLKGFLYLSLFLSSKKVKKIMRRYFAKILSKILIQDNFLRHTNNLSNTIRPDETGGENNVYGNN